MSSPVREATKKELAAIEKLWAGYRELQALGWQDAFYAPRSGERFECIELGSTGIHEAVHLNEKEHGCWIDGDWPSRPLLIKRHGIRGRKKAIGFKCKGCSARVAHQGDFCGECMRERCK